MPDNETCHIEVLKLWPCALEEVQQVEMTWNIYTYDKGTISINFVGNGTPAWLIDLMEKVSGVGSFFRLACRTCLDKFMNLRSARRYRARRRKSHLGHVAFRQPDENLELFHVTWMC